jgi:hypothetical protein
MTSPDSKEPAGPEYSSYYETLVKGQDDRKASLEQRGLAVITTSGTLATLLFGLVALSTKSSDFRLPVQANGPLAVSLTAFAVAAFLALLTNSPLRYENVRISDPQKELWAHWSKDKDDALQRITATRLKVYRQAQRTNDLKARLLLAALFFEVSAVVGVALAVREILLHS